MVDGYGGYNQPKYAIWKTISSGMQVSGTGGILELGPGEAEARRSWNVNYKTVEKLFDVIVEYFRQKPPPEEHDGPGEWVKVRDGMQGAEHCIRVLTPEEFDEWYHCIEVPVQIAFGRKPVAYCSQEGQWWVIYEDMEESEVIAGFEKCFEGQEDEAAPAGQDQNVNAAQDEAAHEISRFFGIVIWIQRDDPMPARFHAAYDSKRVAVSISPFGLLKGNLSPRALSLVTEWATMHQKELLEAWEGRADASKLKTIEPLR